MENWLSENCNLTYFTLQGWRYSKRIRLDQHNMPETKELKDQDTLIEHSFMFKNQFMIIKSVRKKKELLERKLNGKKAK